MNIIQRGTEAKFSIEIADFDMTNNDFAVVLSYGFRHTEIEIKKEDMVNDPENGWCFLFDTTNATGAVTAECTYQVSDNAAEDGIRSVVDRQILCFVASTPRPQMLIYPEGSQETSAVNYQLID